MKCKLFVLKVKNELIYFLKSNSKLSSTLDYIVIIMLLELYRHRHSDIQMDIKIEACFV